MHSQIFQISQHPIPEEDYIDESQYYDNFVGKIADYVQEIQYGQTEKEDLGNRPGLIYNSNDDSITIQDKEKYFKHKYDRFRKEIKKLQNITLKDFCQHTHNQTDQTMFEINMLYEDKYDVYIDDNGEKYGQIPLDDFVRTCKNGDKVYLGAVIDYHY